MFSHFLLSSFISSYFVCLTLYCLILPYFVLFCLYMYKQFNYFYFNKNLLKFQIAAFEKKKSYYIFFFNYIGDILISSRTLYPPLFFSQNILLTGSHFSKNFLRLRCSLNSLMKGHCRVLGVIS